MADKPSRSRFVAPSVEDVRAYCLERRNGIDPHRFVDYYTANGWLVGRNKMKDWKATVRTWERREQPPAEAAPAQRPTYRTVVIDGQEVDVPDV